MINLSSICARYLAHDMIYFMADEKKPHMTASDMAKLRWKGTTPAERSEHARKMVAAREARKAAASEGKE